MATQQIWRLTISCRQWGGKGDRLCVVRNVVHVFKRFVAVVAMACLSSSRLCARVQDKLMCQFGHKVRRQTVFVKLKPPGPSPLRIFGKTCQVSSFLITLVRINVTIITYCFPIWMFIWNKWPSCGTRVGVLCHFSFIVVLWGSFLHNSVTVTYNKQSADRWSCGIFWMKSVKRLSIIVIVLIESKKGE